MLTFALTLFWAVGGRYLPITSAAPRGKLVFRDSCFVIRVSGGAVRVFRDSGWYTGADRYREPGRYSWAERWGGSRWGGGETVRLQQPIHIMTRTVMANPEGVAQITALGVSPGTAIPLKTP